MSNNVLKSETLDSCDILIIILINKLLKYIQMQVLKSPPFLLQTV